MQLTMKEKTSHHFDIDEELLIAGEQVTSKQTLKIYYEALSFSNLELERDLFTRNVRIYEKDHIHEIYTRPNKDLPHLVMLHGFGGTALTYIRTFEHLHEHYQVHALDLFGIGLSSIGTFHDKITQEEAKNYYIDAIEEWRRTLKIEHFTLVGHSFGGYIASLYAEKYLENIDRLILLSPAGTTNKSQEELDQELKKRREAGIGSRIFLCLAESIYNQNFRPSKVMGSCILGNTFTERITSSRLKLKDREKEVWKSYLKALSKQPHSSEAGFYKLFKWPVIPARSIEEIAREIESKVQVQFYFGDEDWMDRKGAEKLKKEDRKIIFEIIENAGHQIIFDNPRAVCQKILRTDRIVNPEEKKPSKTKEMQLEETNELIN